MTGVMMATKDLERERRVVERWNAGGEMADVGADLGLSRNAVAGILNRARQAGAEVRSARADKGPRPGRHGDTDFMLSVVRRWNAGGSLAEVAAALGLRKDQVTHYLRRARAKGVEVRDGLVQRAETSRFARRHGKASGKAKPARTSAGAASAEVTAVEATVKVTRPGRPGGGLLKPDPVAVAIGVKFTGTARPLPAAGTVSVLKRRLFGQCAFTCDAWDDVSAPAMERIRFCAADALPDSPWCSEHWPWATGTLRTRRAA